MGSLKTSIQKWRWLWPSNQIFCDKPWLLEKKVSAFWSNIETFFYLTASNLHGTKSQNLYSRFQEILSTLNVQMQWTSLQNGGSGAGLSLVMSSSTINTFFVVTILETTFEIYKFSNIFSEFELFYWKISKVISKIL